MTIIIITNIVVIDISTTIQISEKTRDRLFQVINKLEKKVGKRLSYNDAIEYLLELQESEIDKKELLTNIRKYMGVLEEGEGKKLLKELRREEFDWEKKRNRY
jgi:hypothetical protein